jgi:hypothetical protein
VVGTAASKTDTGSAVAAEPAASGLGTARAGFGRCWVAAIGTGGTSSSECEGGMETAARAAVGTAPGKG